MYEYKDSARLTLVAVISVSAYLAFDLLFAGAQYLEGPPDPDPSVLRYADLIGVGMLVSLIASVILVGCWIYRASANAHALSDEMTISPGWAVGWYFVPIMNLVRPFQAMREAWMASHYRGNWHQEPTPSLLGWWWGLWIITNILGNISFRLSLTGGADTAGATIMIDLAEAILNVPLCLILIMLMRRMSIAQRTAIHDETFA